MLSLNLTFRRLLRRDLRLTRRQIDEYDSLMAFRQQLSEENRILPNNKIRDAIIKRISNYLDRNYRNHSKQKGFRRVHSYYMARRYHAMKQGYLLQVPSTFSDLTGYFKTLGSYVYWSTRYKIRL